MRILSGMRPTGRFHLGNYLGAAKNWVELQKEHECFFFVADYHALTTEPDGHKAEDKVFDLTADLITVGKQRMSKTVGNIIGVTDDPEVIRKQVLSMVTDVKRPRRTDPGHPRTCNVCAYYKLFFDDWEHYWELCRKAQIGCYDKKKLLAERLIELFRPFREVRAELSPGQVSAILDEGSEKAREVASRTMVEVRQAVGLPSYLNAPGR